jgi:hypothetical protein
MRALMILVFGEHFNVFAPAKKKKKQGGGKRMTMENATKKETATA